MQNQYIGILNQTFRSISRKYLTLNQKKVEDNSQHLVHVLSTMTLNAKVVLIETYGTPSQTGAIYWIGKWTENHILMHKKHNISLHVSLDCLGHTCMTIYLLGWMSRSVNHILNDGTQM